MTDQRRLSVWLMLVGIAIVLGTIAVAWGVGFWLYVVLFAVTVALHWAYACRRCSNADCALNARGACFVFGRGCAVEDAVCSREPVLCIDSIWAAPPMAAVVLLGLYMAWMAAPEAAVASFLFLAVGLVLYSNQTCTSCVNRCPVNRNPRRAGSAPHGRTAVGEGSDTGRNAADTE